MPSPLEGEMGCSSSVPTSSDEEGTCMSHDIQSQVPIKAQSSIETPSGCGYVVELITPAAPDTRTVLQSDDNITPMPDYRTMATPHLKVIIIIIISSIAYQYIHVSENVFLFIFGKIWPKSLYYSTGTLA